ncbi:MAG TPA: hypothetical protein VF184_10690 [Phycisphaeraceae bacterium]
MAHHHDDACERTVRSFVSRVGWVLFLRWGLLLTAGWCFLWGTAVLALRVVTDLPWPVLLWGAAGLAPAVAGAGFWAWRCRPTQAAARALLDRTSRAGGLLMAQEEADLRRWRQRIPPLRAPAVRWQGQRQVALTLLAALFLLGSFLVPADFAHQAQSRPLNIDGPTQQLAEQINLLEEERILDDQQAQDLRQDLERLAQQATAEDPVKTWEALDHLADKLQNTASQTAERTLRQTEQATQSQTLAEALAGENGLLGEEALTTAMAELAAQVQQAMAENEALSESLGEGLREALQAGELSPQQLAALAQAMAGQKLAMEQMMARLADARLIDEQLLAMCKQLGQSDSEELRKLLAECQGDKEALLALCRRPGRGGVSRGRGDAEMIWKTQASSEEGVSFKEQVLPAASLEALRESRMVGVSQGTPQVDEAAGPSAGGALQGAAASGGSAVSHRVLPRHRATVQRYFDRQQDKPPMTTDGRE